MWIDQLLGENKIAGWTYDVAEKIVWSNSGAAPVRGSRSATSQFHL